jgi:hypothetical protein
MTYGLCTTRKGRWLGLCLPLAVLAGCQVIPDKGLSCPADQVIETGFNSHPRIRFGCYPSSTVGTSFVGPNLGRHGYHYRPLEKDGIAYTCRGGDIDIIHLRIAADWTAYLASKAYKTIMDGKPGFSYKLAVDRSHSTVRITYPPNWDQMSAQERSAAAKDVALALGPYLSFTVTTWHEILTWFGFRCIGLPTEFPSAFSWEDSYSNLLGTVVAVHALQDGEHPYNEAVKIAIDREMEGLGIQSAEVARQASERVKGTWFTGSVLFFVDIMKRNLDVGLDDGRVTPTLLPGVSECPDAEPVSYPVPTLDALSRHGFSAAVEIRPKEWERGKIFEVLFGDRRDRPIDPAVHIPRLMEYIRRDAVEHYHYLVDPGSSP